MQTKQTYVTMSHTLVSNHALKKMIYDKKNIGTSRSKVGLPRHACNTLKHNSTSIWSVTYLDFKFILDYCYLSSSQHVPIMGMLQGVRFGKSWTSLGRGTAAPNLALCFPEPSKPTLTSSITRGRVEML